MPKIDLFELHGVKMLASTRGDRKKTILVLIWTRFQMNGIYKC